MANVKVRDEITEYISKQSMGAEASSDPYNEAKLFYDTPVIKTFDNSIINFAPLVEKGNSYY